MGKKKESRIHRILLIMHLVTAISFVTFIFSKYQVNSFVASDYFSKIVDPLWSQPQINANFARTPLNPDGSIPALTLN